MFQQIIKGILLLFGRTSTGVVTPLRVDTDGHLQIDITGLPLASASPAQIDFNDTAVVGTSSLAAREDHQHAFPWTNRKNFIINGMFDVWQKGTSFPAIANNTYHADRWNYAEISDAVHTISQSTNVPTLTDGAANFSLLVDCTTADAAVAAGDWCAIHQKVEGYWLKYLLGRPVTLSFWVKATKIGTYCIAFRSAGAALRSYIAEYTVNVTNTWEYKTITFTMDAASANWLMTNGTGLGIFFTLMCGSTYHGATGAWATADYRGSANQVNACDSTDNNFQLARVQLELGGVATDIEPRSYGEEMALCSRYCRAFGGTNAYERIATGAIASTTRMTVAVILDPPMRAAPTLSYSNVTHWAVEEVVSFIQCTALTASPALPYLCAILVDVAAGLTAGSAGNLITNNTTDARLYLTAEL